MQKRQEIQVQTPSREKVGLKLNIQKIKIMASSPITSWQIDRETVKQSFHVFVSHLYVFFGEMSICVFCPFFNWVVCFSDIELHELFIYFGD